MAFQQSLRKNG